MLKQKILAILNVVGNRGQYNLKFALQNVFITKILVKDSNKSFQNCERLHRGQDWYTWFLEKLHYSNRIKYRTKIQEAYVFRSIGKTLHILFAQPILKT